MPTKDLYTHLIDLLDKNKATYRLIDHAPEGRTEIVSGFRGNKVSQAAKCMVLSVKMGKNGTKYVLGVIPGDAKINFKAVQQAFKGTYVSFAPVEVAEKLAGSVAGTVLPFSFNEELELIVDPLLLKNEEIFFNVARLDRSMALRTKDYEKLTKPRLESIADYGAPAGGAAKPKSKLDKSSRLYQLRHSCSHALAQAVLQMFPEAKLAIGPPIENGFYYDFELPRTLIPEDLPLLEEKMCAIIKEKQTFVRRDEPVKEAIAFLKKAKQPYKVDLVEGFAKGDTETVSFYENVDQNGKVKFVDLCEGNHVENLSEIKAFKLLHTAGAYWRGDEKNKMLQRIYGTSFETKEELDLHLHQMEEAKKRDHRKLGKELELFMISEEVGGGLPMFYPKGTILRRMVENYITELQESRGYVPIWIPHITKGRLYEISGHLDKYDAMYPPMELKDEANYYMKPMNCPHFMMMYKSMAHSYRDLPLRYTCTTTNYRYEKSGELSGLTRVRALTQDDCHVFTTPERIESEINLMLDMIKEVYQKFGFEDFWVRISTRDPADKQKYIGSSEVWDESETALARLIKKRGWTHEIGVGEAAFYGPKLDFILKDVIGREWQLSTIQLDMNLPQRFELEYQDADGKMKRPVVIHRAILGSTERFLAILIEHYGGAFPLWLAPEQIRILPVSDKFLEYAHTIEEILRGEKYRVSVDDAGEGLGKKIRNAELQKVPYMIVVGEKEEAAQTIAVRDYATKKQEVMGVREFLKSLKS